MKYISIAILIETVVAIETSEEMAEPTQVYKASEIQEPPVLPKPPQGRKDARQYIDYRAGPTIVNLPFSPLDSLPAKLNVSQVTGYIDAITYSLLAEIHILGIKLDTFEGNIKKGLEVKIDITAASGIIGFEMRNGNEAWIVQKVALRFGEEFEREEKLFEIRTEGERILLGQGREGLAKL